MNQSQCRNKRDGGALLSPASTLRVPADLHSLWAVGGGGAGGDLPRSSLAECPGTESLVRAPGLLAHRLPFAPLALSRVCDLGVASAKAGLRIPRAQFSSGQAGLLEVPRPESHPLTHEECVCVCEASRPGGGRA